MYIFAQTLCSNKVCKLHEVIGKFVITNQLLERNGSYTLSSILIDRLGAGRTSNNGVCLFDVIIHGYYAHSCQIKWEGRSGARYIRSTYNVRQIAELVCCVCVWRYLKSTVSTWRVDLSWMEMFDLDSRPFQAPFASRHSVGVVDLHWHELGGRVSFAYTQQFKVPASSQLELQYHCTVLVCPPSLKSRLRAFNGFQSESRNDQIDVHNGLVVMENGSIQIWKLQNFMCYMAKIHILFVPNWLRAFTQWQIAPRKLRESVFCGGGLAVQPSKRHRSQCNLIFCRNCRKWKVIIHPTKY